MYIKSKSSLNIYWDQLNFHLFVCVYTLNLHGTEVYHATIVPTWSYMMILSAMVYNDVAWKNKQTEKQIY